MVGELDNDQGPSFYLAFGPLGMVRHLDFNYLFGAVIMDLYAISSERRDPTCEKMV